MQGIKTVKRTYTRKNESRAEIPKRLPRTTKSIFPDVPTTRVEVQNASLSSDNSFSPCKTLESSRWKDSFDKFLTERMESQNKIPLKKKVRTSFNMDSSYENSFIAKTQNKQLLLPSETSTSASTPIRTDSAGSLLCDISPIKGKLKLLPRSNEKEGNKSKPFEYSSLHAEGSTIYEKASSGFIKQSFGTNSKSPKATKSDSNIFANTTSEEEIGKSKQLSKADSIKQKSSKSPKTTKSASNIFANTTSEEEICKIIGVDCVQQKKPPQIHEEERKSARKRVSNTRYSDFIAPTIDKSVESVYKGDIAPQEKAGKITSTELSSDKSVSSESANGGEMDADLNKYKRGQKKKIIEDLKKSSDTDSENSQKTSARPARNKIKNKRHQYDFLYETGKKKSESKLDSTEEADKSLKSISLNSTVSVTKDKADKSLQCISLNSTTSLNLSKPAEKILKTTPVVKQVPQTSITSNKSTFDLNKFMDKIDKSLKITPLNRSISLNFNQPKVKSPRKVTETTSSPEVGLVISQRPEKISGFGGSLSIPTYSIKALDDAVNTSSPQKTNLSDDSIVIVEQIGPGASKIPGKIQIKSVSSEKSTQKLKLIDTQDKIEEKIKSLEQTAGTQVIEEVKLPKMVKQPLKEKIDDKIIKSPPKIITKQISKEKIEEKIKSPPKKVAKEAAIKKVVEEPKTLLSSRFKKARKTTANIIEITDTEDDDSIIVSAIKSRKTTGSEDLMALDRPRRQLKPNKKYGEFVCEIYDSKPDDDSKKESKNVQKPPENLQTPEISRQNNTTRKTKSIEKSSPVPVEKSNNVAARKSKSIDKSLSLADIAKKMGLRKIPTAALSPVTTLPTQKVNTDKNKYSLSLTKGRAVEREKQKRKSSSIEKEEEEENSDDEPLVAPKRKKNNSVEENAIESEIRRTGRVKKINPLYKDFVVEGLTPPASPSIEKPKNSSPAVVAKSKTVPKPSPVKQAKIIPKKPSPMLKSKIKKIPAPQPPSSPIETERPQRKRKINPIYENFVTGFKKANVPKKSLALINIENVSVQVIESDSDSSSSSSSGSSSGSSSSSCSSRSSSDSEEGDENDDVSKLNVEKPRKTVVFGAKDSVLEISTRDPKMNVILKAGKWRKSMVGWKKSHNSTAQAQCDATVNSNCSMRLSKNRRMSIKIIEIPEESEDEYEDAITAISNRLQESFSNSILLEPTDDETCNLSGLSLRDETKLSSKTLFSRHTSLVDKFDDLQKSQQPARRRRTSVLDKTSATYRDVDIITKLNSKEIILRRCKQSEPLPFNEIYSESNLRQCRKIGEGVYGEVFMNKKLNGEVFVLKIIPIEGEIEVNGETQKRFDEILSEIIIAMELSNLRNTKDFMTNGFVEVVNVRCVQGSYPEHLIDLWELYRDNRGTDNDHPEIFPEDQLYIVLELANAGEDLEAFTFDNAIQAQSAFLQTAITLGIAEKKFQFEHRDLHWGNILLKHTDDKEIEYKLEGEVLKIPTHGVKATIIDFTLSRMFFDECRLYNDLANDDELFSASGDYQFEIYRLMKNHLCNCWGRYEPFTNILWLHYTLDKMINGARYRLKKSGKHRNAINEMIKLRDELMNNKSAYEYAKLMETNE